MYIKNLYTEKEANPDSLSTILYIVLRESGLASPTVYKDIINFFVKQTRAFRRSILY